VTVSLHTTLKWFIRVANAGVNACLARKTAYCQCITQF
jgi:hypothetical protein